MEKQTINCKFNYKNAYENISCSSKDAVTIERFHDYETVRLHHLCPFRWNKDGALFCKFYVSKVEWKIVSCCNSNVIKTGFASEDDALQFICNHGLQNCTVMPVDQ